MLEKDHELECRVCLEQVDSAANPVSLFQVWTSPWEGIENTIAEDLSKLGHVEILSTDPHSKFICNSCYTNLQSACNFVAVVQKSDKVLRQRFPCAESDPCNATGWPKPIQLDQNINGTVFETVLDIKIKQEVLSDPDYGDNINGISAQYEDLTDGAEIKIEPEELMKPQQIKINGIFSYKEATENPALLNGDELIGEFLDAPLKEEPTSEVDSDTDIPLECMLCAKSFQSISGLKAHVIAQHSYKSINRRDKLSQSKKKERYVCATCRRSFVTSTDLMVHETCHNKATCYGCNQKFDTFEQLSRHRTRCKIISSKDLPKPKTLEDVKRLIKEENRSPDDEDLPKEQLQCHLCIERFSDSYYMKIHQEIHHSSGEQPQPACSDVPAMETATLESIFSEDN